MILIFFARTIRQAEENEAAKQIHEEKLAKYLEQLEIEQSKAFDTIDHTKVSFNSSYLNLK